MKISTLFSKEVKDLEEDIEGTVETLVAWPGSVGNIMWGAIRNFKLLDTVFLLPTLTGIAWLIFGYGLDDNHDALLAKIAFAPIALWLLLGLIGGITFHYSGMGKGSFQYPETYGLLVFFALFGFISFRIALDPRDTNVAYGNHKPTS